MKRLKGIISALLTAILLLPGKQLISAPKTTQITCTLQSPKDGSLWMGTEDSGLLRIGRNGRQIIYNKTSGHLSSDKIEALAMEEETGIIYILDGNGSLYKYTSVSGFSPVNGFPTLVCAITADPQRQNIYAATAEKLYRFTSSTAPQELAALPFQPQKIACGENENLWIIGESGVVQIDKNGHTTVQNADFSLDVSNSNTFEFDTTPSEQPITESRTQALPWILSAILFLALATVTVVTFIRKKDRPEEKPVALEEKPVALEEKPIAPEEKPVALEEKPAAPEEKPASPKKTETAQKSPRKETATVKKPAAIKEKTPREAAPTHLSDTAVTELKEKLNASDFGKKVLALTEESLTDPNFGVEQISEKLGISRIHVNRKLKAETGYSPSFVIKAIRMDKARGFLSDGSHSVTQVAATCGFSSASYFSTAFKEYYGISPSEYLENIVQPNALPMQLD